MFAVTQTIFFSHKLSFLETIEHIDYKIKLKCHEKSFFLSVEVTIKFNMIFFVFCDPYLA